MTSLKAVYLSLCLYCWPLELDRVLVMCSNIRFIPGIVGLKPIIMIMNGHWAHKALKYTQTGNNICIWCAQR